LRGILEVVDVQYSLKHTYVGVTYFFPHSTLNQIFWLNTLELSYKYITTNYHRLMISIINYINEESIKMT